mmetsp:Transcript_26959/g.57727  ORF Transcript_26959/g.57727 Transcript_26959/m.57727 type:complete len:824 (+) Transcript_26959:10-2481(+)
MKCSRHLSLRLLSYLLFPGPAAFLQTSALQATSVIRFNKVSCFSTNVATLDLHQNCRFCRWRCYRSKNFIGTGTACRMVSAKTEIEEDTNASSSTSNPLPSSPYTVAFPTLCPKCRGEGKLSRAPSKKARLRHQRRIYQEEQERRHKQAAAHNESHKRIKRSSSTALSSTTTHQENSNANSNNESKKKQEAKLPMLPRRWDPCSKCDQTGLLMVPSNNISSGPSSVAANIHHRPFVAIIGGGIGGMALAVALRHRGIPFRVYEKDCRFDQRSQGYGLTLQQARRALQALGIFENDDGNNSWSTQSGKLLQEHAVTSTKHVVHTPDGKQVGEWGLRKWVGGGNSTDNAGNHSEGNNSDSFKNEHGIGVNSKDENSNITATNDTNTKAWKNLTIWTKTKPFSSRAKNKKRRQNLHVPRQTLRYTLLEALKEASSTGNDKASIAASASTIEQITDNDDERLDISWGHELISMQPLANDSCANEVELSFQVVDENGTEKGVVTSQANLVVGCDGIRSSVRQQFLLADTTNNDESHTIDDKKHQDVSSTPLRYLNCVVVLGICPLGDLFPQQARSRTDEQRQRQIELSPLLDGETVFQTADGTTRIYLMPYSKKNNEYMWQLSFPVSEEDVAIEMSRRGPKALKEEALRRCQSWHVPIPDILKATPKELVSGYPVYDRDILTTGILSASRSEMAATLSGLGEGQKGNSTGHKMTKPIHASVASGSIPITLLGDAAHPMSPFKGQGANQALLDALSLARVLYRIRCREGRSLGEALECYENEMLDRSAEKVRASSAAARFLHTHIAIQEGDVTRGAAAAVAECTSSANN